MSIKPESLSAAVLQFRPRNHKGSDCKDALTTAHAEAGSVLLALLPHKEVAHFSDAPAGLGGIDEPSCMAII